MTKKTFSHPLRDIRRAIGKSRPHFAALIGCTEHSIKRIENGRLKLSEKLAHRIYFATGANWHQLLLGKSGKALDWRSIPYAQESFQKWKDSGGAMGKGTPIPDILKWTKLTLDVANEKGKLPNVIQSLAQCLNSIRDDFKLAEAIDQELKSREFTETKRFQIKQLRDNPSLAKYWKINVNEKDIAAHKNSDGIEVTAHFTRLWNPEGDPPPDKIKPRSA